MNRDVWHAFQRSYRALDAEAFLDLYAPELIRAGGPAKEVLGYAEYAAQTRQFFADLTELGRGIGIEFRFLERLVSGELASERGVFRITATPASGEQRIFYGQFHTFARKVDGRWRIVADYDSNDGGSVTSETFDAAGELDDVARFAD